MNGQKRLFIVVKLCLIKLLIFLFGDFVLVLSPKRYHAVQLRRGDNGFVFVLTALFKLRFGHIHHNRVADIIGILFNDVLDCVLFKILVVIEFFGLFLDFQGNDGARFALFGFLNRIAVGSA